MSLLPSATFSAPGISLYSSGGGTLPATAYISTISTSALYLENINSAGNFPFRLRSNSGSAFIENTASGALGDFSVSTLTVSSINTAPPPQELFQRLFAANPSLSTISFS